MTTERTRAKCPSCGLMFAKFRSNQRYCSVPCRQHAIDARRGKVTRADPKELRQRQRKRSCGKTRGAQSTMKLWNGNGNTLVDKGCAAPKPQPSVNFIEGWRGFDGCRGYEVFLPHREKPLSHLECIAAGVKYPAIDRGVYRVVT